MTDRSLRVMLFVHVFLFALVVGVFWGTWFSLSRSMSAITASTFLEVGHTMIGNLGGPMAVLMPATLVSAVPVDTLPSDWSSIRNRWEAFHAARTFISLAGFGSALAAALWSREDATPLV